jgi:hypothetical protein
MLNLHDHVRLTNTQRLHLAQEACRDLDPSPFSARERVRGALTILRSATLGEGRTEEAVYTACHHRAGALQHLLAAPAQISFTESIAAFDAARNHEENHP